MEISLFTPAATLIVGGAVSYVAFQQWLLARHKFRLDLYDRRYRVYEACQRFLSVIISFANFSDEDLRTYTIGTMDAVFLYPQHIKDYILEIRKRALDLRKYQKEFEPLEVGARRSELVELNHQEMLWLMNQITQLPKVFSPFLGFASAR